jgi:hypothetical protein
MSKGMSRPRMLGFLSDLKKTIAIRKMLNDATWIEEEKIKNIK